MCSSCGTSFEQGRGSLIIVCPPDGPPEPTTASTLLADVERRGGPGIKKESLFRESRVVFGRAEGHDVIRWRGEVLGFSERISWKGRGLLRLEGEALSFRPGGGAGGFFVSSGRDSGGSDQLEGAPSHAGGHAPVPVRTVG